MLPLEQLQVSVACFGRERELRVDFGGDSAAVSEDALDLFEAESFGAEHGRERVALCRVPDYAARIKTNRPKALGIQGVLARQPFNMRHSPEARDQSCLRKASNSSSG